MNSMSNSPLMLMVEGNMGAGKSTFLRIIQQKLNLDIIYEPTDKWQNASDAGNLLNLFYQDTPRWAYTFQSYAFISRVQTILEYQTKKPSGSSNVQILERSVYCDRYCFAKNCFESGLMSNLEWQIYKEWFTWLVEKYTPRPSGFIYLRTTPETCFERMKKRNRHEEAGVSKSYVESLHNRHEDWLINQKELTPFLATVPILVLDCNNDFETDLQQQAKHLKTLQQFIDEKIIPFGHTLQQPYQTTL